MPEPTAHSMPHVLDVTRACRKPPPVINCKMAPSFSVLVFLAALVGLGTPLATPPTSYRHLYDKIDATLRRARTKESGAGAHFARSLGNRWTEMQPEKLVEATLVAGATVLEDFDEGFEILREAEDGASLNVSGTAYSALMRLAAAEERPVEALALLARTRAYSVDRTEGLLLSAMRAAAALDDWGAVARLYAELADGPDAAAMAAVELETIADATVLEEMRATLGSATETSPAPAVLAQALTLGLHAHCERGDIGRVTTLLERKRARAAVLDFDEYLRLWRLARTSGRAEPLLALRPIDLQRSLADAVEPPLFALQSQLGLAAASLGVVERRIAAGVAAAAVVALVAAIVAGGAAPDAATVAPGSTQEAIDSLAAVNGLYR